MEWVVNLVLGSVLTRLQLVRFGSVAKTLELSARQSRFLLIVRRLLLGIQVLLRSDLVYKAPSLGSLKFQQTHCLGHGLFELEANPHSPVQFYLPECSLGHLV